MFSSLTYQKPAYIGFHHQADEINTKIIQQYIQIKDSSEVRRTHHFFGRFENTYISKTDIPEISKILNMGLFYASSILDVPQEQLKYGFWFNEMQPGDQTTLHSHEEDDELLSAVYYIKAQKESGDLIIQQNAIDHHHEPESGKMILFNPDIPHKVTINNSDSLRLSVAMNFGPKT